MQFSFTRIRLRSTDRSGKLEDAQEHEPAGYLLTAPIERFEVLRGPQSGLYRSDAIGVVISIITKSGSGPPQLR